MPTRWQNLTGAFWNGLLSKPQSPQVNAESTQNPALDKNQVSQGTQVDWSHPVPSIERPFSAYDMSPVNGRHWTKYLETSYGTSVPSTRAVNPANVLMAVSKEQDNGSIGPQDVWAKEYEVRNDMIRIITTINWH